MQSNFRAMRICPGDVLHSDNMPVQFFITQQSKTAYWTENSCCLYFSK